jgi:hypothetical protein
MMIRPSPTSIATPVRPTKQQTTHTTTKEFLPNGSARY